MINCGKKEHDDMHGRRLDAEGIQSAKRLKTLKGQSCNIDKFNGCV